MALDSSGNAIVADRSNNRIRVVTPGGVVTTLAGNGNWQGFVDGTGTGGSDLGTLPAEFTRQRGFVRGTVGAARTGDPNSANSQFYIMFAPAPHLDGQYTIWGQVTEGMDHIDAIKRGAGGSGTVSNPDKIVSVKVAADAG